MHVKRVVNAQKFSPEKMQKVNLFETANFFCDIYCLEPGQSQSPHAHAGADKMYFVLEGEISVQIGAEDSPLRSGEMVLAPSGAVHGIKNTNEQRTVVLVTMAPNPNRKNTSGGGA